MNILYLDDNQTDIIYIKRLLADTHNVAGVTTLAQALTLLDERCETFELIFIDFHLEGCDGLSAYSIITQKYPEIPAILLTGEGNEELIIDSMRIGFDSYINKDKVDKITLLDKISDALHQHQIKLQHKKKLSALEHKALYDPLTQLANKELLLDKIESEIINQSRHALPFGVMFIDLDGFKAVNDTCGHTAGDELLVLVAAIIKNTVRQGDTVARFGGDEFVILLPNLPSLSPAIHIANTLLKLISGVKSIGSQPISLSASIGVTQYEPHESYTSLIQRADEAMYAAKQQGKNSYVCKNSAPANEG